MISPKQKKITGIVSTFLIMNVESRTPWLTLSPPRDPSKYFYTDVHESSSNVLDKWPQQIPSIWALNISTITDQFNRHYRKILNNDLFFSFNESFGNFPQILWQM